MRRGKARYGNERNSILEQNDLESFLYMLETSNSSTDSSDTWLQMPRKPKWNCNLSPEEYQKLEYQSFLTWRKRLAEIEESDYGILTPFERNLEIWKQLWQVAERCSVIVQILDARNPLLYLSKDLFKYAQELDPNKRLLLLLNKSDYLTPKQLKIWANYFNSKAYDFIFYSALDESDSGANDPIEDQEEAISINQERVISPRDFGEILSRLFENQKIGFVGYPNVGKSSTINSLLKKKATSISSTPGKTKHLQSHYLSDNRTMIFDCPGLVFPNIACSKAELVVNGILSIDQLRDWQEPMKLLLSRIPIESLCEAYHVNVEMLENEKSERCFLELLARKKGFFTSNFGNPDVSRVSRIVLKDYVSGKLLYCHPPPEISIEEYTDKPIRILERKCAINLESYYERLKS